MTFREYDIRGIVNNQLTTAFAETLGKALGTYIKGTIAVGRDNRLSSERFRNAIVRGILSTGCDVVEMGHITTPMLFFAVRRYRKKHNVKGGVIITGSHHPKNYNGFKMVYKNTQISGKEIQKIKSMMQTGKFRQGQGKLIIRNPLKSYAKFLLESFRFGKKLKVAVECGNGMAGIIAPGVLELLGCKVITLNRVPDGKFPSLTPDPSKPNNMKNLIKTVIREKADIGLAFDGDVDRLGAVTDKGEILDADKILILLARETLKHKKKAKIVYDIKCSDLVNWEIKKNNGKPIEWKTGRTFISQKMRQEKADIGGELTGHFFFKELDYFDDAFYAACKLLEIISRSNAKPSEIASTIPKTYNTHEIRIKCPEEKKQAAMEKLKEEFKQYKTSTLDGIKIRLTGGWALIRPSNTEPALVLRFEANSEERLKEIRKTIEKKARQQT